MKILKARIPIVLACLCLVLTTAAAAAEEPIRGLVVDTGDDLLWLGLPGPVRQGAVFDVMMVPGGEVIARAEVIQCTPDSPYVAQARFALEDPCVVIPIGAYVEATSDVCATRLEELGYMPLTLGPKEKPNPLTLQAGAFFPTDDDLADETTDVWPALELSYRVSDSDACEIRLGAGYIHGDGNFSVNGVGGFRELRVYPVTVEAKLRTAREGWYARLGAGAYFVYDDRSLGGVTTSRSDTEFGWKAGFGYESKSGRMAELQYVDVSNTEFQGVMFSFGARF